MTDKITVEDFRGNTYGVGDTVLYPRMSGRSCELQEGTVVEIKWYEDSEYYRDEPSGRWLTRPVQKHKVRVQPTKSSRFGRNAVNWAGTETKPVWISIGENVVKVY